MALPVSVRLRDDPRTEIRGVTRDVSSGGAFVFLQPNELAECDSAEFSVELPAEVTLSEALKVVCCARVLRIERSAGGVVGKAVQIADFDFLASTQAGRGPRCRCHILVGFG